MVDVNEKKCSSCGEAMAPDAAFCTRCGNRLTNDANVKKCSSCGETLKPDAAFCTNCGSRLGENKTQSPRAGSPIGTQLLRLANDFLSVREVSPTRFEFSSTTGAQIPVQKIKIKYDALVSLNPEQKELTFWEKMVESSSGMDAGFSVEKHVQKGMDVGKAIHGQLLFGGKYGFEYGKLREVVKAIAGEQGWTFKTVILRTKDSVGEGKDFLKKIPAPKILLPVLALLLVAALATVIYFLSSGRSAQKQALFPSQSQSEMRPGAGEAEDADQMGFSESRVFQKQGTVAGGRPFIATDKDVYYSGEKIRVHYYNAPGYSRDWICIVPAGSRHTVAGNYQYIPRRGRGVLTFSAPRPGRYEVRAYYSYSPSQYKISARHSFTVQSR